MATTPERNLGGKLWLTVLGLILAGAGAVGTGFLWKAYSRSKEEQKWQKMHTVIDRSEMEEVKDSLNAAPRFEVTIKYSYTVDLKSIESYRVKRADANIIGKPKVTRSIADKSVAEKLLADYPMSKSTFCYVNPEDPTQAVLEQAGFGSIYSIWFPLLFVAGGLGMVINIWLPHPSDKIKLKA
jgi:hypothetical protein